MTSKKSYPTSAQKMRLVSLLEADEELRNSKFSANFTKKIAESRWKYISDELNAIPGAKKEWMEWRKCWQDMRSKCKKKNTIIRRSQSGTGGGPPAPTLSVEEEGIINLIHCNSLIGHADSKESLATFKGIKIINNDLVAPAAQINPSPDGVVENVDSKKSIGTYKGIKIINNKLVAPAAPIKHVPVEMGDEVIEHVDSKKSIGTYKGIKIINNKLVAPAVQIQHIPVEMGDGVGEHVHSKKSTGTYKGIKIINNKLVAPAVQIQHIPVEMGDGVGEHVHSKKSIGTYKGIKIINNELVAPAAQTKPIPGGVENLVAQSSSKEAKQVGSSELMPPAEGVQENKENKRVLCRNNLKKKPQKRLQDNYNIAVEYKTALTEKNRLLKEKNALQKTFFSAILLQMQQQNNTLSRLADHLINNSK